MFSSHLVAACSLLASVACVVPADNSACPDPAYKCPGSETCCKNTQDQWGCCSISSAVCCEDRIHCCPAGTTCGATGCSHGFSNSTMVKTTSVKVPSKSANAVCPDPSYSCPGSETCCKNAEDEWACCGLDSAVCCEDREHCCPQGYMCGASGCMRSTGNTLIVKPALVKILAVRTQAVKSIVPSGNTMTGKPIVPSVHRPSSNAICPDPSYMCPGTHTCCLGADSQWKCCDLDTPGVCCEDREHCCPAGTVCGVDGCSRRAAYGDISTIAPFAVTIPATKVQRKP